MTTRAAELAALVGAFDEASLMERPTLGLLDEMERRGAVEAAVELASSPDAGDRLLAARLMHLLPHESYVAALEALAGDPDEGVAKDARIAFRGQRRTDAWHAAAARIGEG